MNQRTLTLEKALQFVVKHFFPAFKFHEAVLLNKVANYPLINYLGTWGGTVLFFRNGLFAYNFFRLY